jgi:hypothetical protein
LKDKKTFILKAIEGDETLTNSIKQSTQQRGKRRTKERERLREREREDPSHQARRAKPTESSMLKSEVQCRRR